MKENIKAKVNFQGRKKHDRACEQKGQLTEKERKKEKDNTMKKKV